MRSRDDEPRRFGLPRMRGRRHRASHIESEECFHSAVDHSITGSEKIDEVLERLWMLAEVGKSPVGIIELLDGMKDCESTVSNAITQGLISGTEEALTLTPSGKKWAEQIVRRHRLAEVLLHEILEVEEEEIEHGACQFEHILSAKVADSICTLLGHPPVCPHGRPIPRGECCKKFQQELTPLVVPLNELVPGETVRIVFITPKTHTRLDKLGALGIVPGSTIRLHQKQPTFILQVGETDVAIDPDIAREIFVRRL